MNKKNTKVKKDEEFDEGWETEEELEEEQSIRSNLISLFPDHFAENPLDYSYSGKTFLINFMYIRQITGFT